MPAILFAVGNARSLSTVAISQSATAFVVIDTTPFLVDQASPEPPEVAPVNGVQFGVNMDGMSSLRTPHEIGILKHQSFALAVVDQIPRTPECLFNRLVALAAHNGEPTG